MLKNLPVFQFHLAHIVNFYNLKKLAITNTSRKIRRKMFTYQKERLVPKIHNKNTSNQS